MHLDADTLLSWMAHEIQGLRRKAGQARRRSVQLARAGHPWAGRYASAAIAFDAAADAMRSCLVDEEAGRARRRGG